MYQSKPSLREESVSSSSTRSNWGWRPVRARLAWTRWAFDSGTSQSGSVVGTSADSYSHHVSIVFNPASLHRPSPIHQRTQQDTGCKHTPLTKSKITLIATQNSSKSKFPSPSTSAKSHTLSNFSSPNPEFLRTGAACDPLRCVPPFVSDAKISQYFSISSGLISCVDIVRLCGCIIY